MYALPAAVAPMLVALLERTIEGKQQHFERSDLVSQVPLERLCRPILEEFMADNEHGLIVEGPLPTYSRVVDARSLVARRACTHRPDEHASGLRCLQDAKTSSVDWVVQQSASHTSQ